MQGIMIQEKWGHLGNFGLLTRLSTGASVFAYELRLLRNAGIREFVIAAPPEAMEALGRESQCSHFSDCQFTFVSVPEGASPLFCAKDSLGQDNALIVHGDLVFDAPALEAFLAKDYSRQVVIDREQTKSNAVHPIKARLGMKDILQIGDGLSGVGCFSLLPLFRLDQEGLSLLLSVLSEEDSLFSVLNKILPDLHLRPFSLDNYFFRALSGNLEEDEPVLRKLNQTLSRQHILHKRGSILQIGELMESFGIHAPLLVHNASYDNLPVKDVFAHFGIVPVPFQVDGMIREEQIMTAAQLFREKGLDGFISVGDDQTIDAAKCIKLCLGDDFSPQSFSEPFFSPFAHIAIPTAAEKGAESTPFATFLKDGQPFSFSQPCIRPDAAILDSNIWNYENPSAQKQALPKKVKKCSHTSIVNKIRQSLFWQYQRLRRTTDYKTIVFVTEQSCSHGLLSVYQAIYRDPAYCNFRLIWAVLDTSSFRFLEQNDRTWIVKQHSSTFYLECARAALWIADCNLPAFMKPRKGQLYFRILAEKPFALFGWDGPEQGFAYKRRFAQAARRFTHLFSPAPVFDNSLRSAFHLSSKGLKKILHHAGSPENDQLFALSSVDILTAKMQLGLCLHKKAILLAVDEPMDLAPLERAFPDCAFLIHPSYPQANGVPASIDDLRQLLIACDLLVCSHVALAADFAVLGRPVLLYGAIQEDRLYFSYNDILLPRIENQGNLLSEIQSALQGNEPDISSFCKQFLPLDRPNSAHDIVQFIPSFPHLSQRDRFYKSALRLKNNLFVWIGAKLRSLGLCRDANYRALQAYRQKHQGERCFLVGNGPSLTIDDLEKLKNEITFCCNLIYKIWDRTSWRPTYYCMTDQVFADTLSKEMAEALTMPLFLSEKLRKKATALPKYTMFIKRYVHDPYFVHGNPLEYFVPSNATVMTLMIELAMYMGFQEIYLIGVDCSNGFVHGGHFIEEYESKEMLQMEHGRAKHLVEGRQMTLDELGKYRNDRSVQAYGLLLDYAQKRGIKIINATRGGCLEVFPRVNLENVLQEKNHC